MELAIMVAVTGHVGTKLAIFSSTERALVAPEARLVPNGPRAWKFLTPDETNGSGRGLAKQLKGGPQVG